MSQLRCDWRGTYVVMVTPFADNELDRSAIEQLTDILCREGADGLVVAGSTGEWFAMTQDERIELFRLVSKAAAGRVKLIAGATAIRTCDAVLLAEAAKAAGYDGALILPPPYIMPTERELVAYFASVDEVGLPLMLYNNPARTGINLDARLLQRLLPTLKNAVALKDSVTDIHHMSATMRAIGREIAIFTGFETYIVPATSRGVRGVIAMAPNVLGARVMPLFDLASQGKVRELRPMQEMVDRLYDLMYTRGYNPYVILKEAMRLLGRPGGEARPPLAPMTGEDRAWLKSFLDVELA